VARDELGRVEGHCLFATYQWGKPQAPIYRGNAEGVKLPHRYVAEKTCPRALELKKSLSSLKSYKLCKDLIPRLFSFMLARINLIPDSTAVFSPVRGP